MTLWLTLQEKGMLRVSDSDAPPAAVDEAATNAVSNGSAIPNGAIPNGAIPNGAILKGSAVSNGSAVATAGAVHLAGNNVTGNQLVGNSAASDSELTLEGALDRLIDHHSSPPKPDVTNPAVLPKYEPDVGVRLQLPRLDKDGAGWEGANLVPVSNQRAASLRYQLDGHRVTLYVFNASKLRVRKHADRGSKIDNPIYVGRWRGYTVAAKEHFGTGYAIAGDMDDAAITEMMTAIH